MQSEETISHEQYIQEGGLEYINGDKVLPAVGKNILRCGQCIGCWKSWLPFCGCFCSCCRDPFIEVPQGNIGLKTQFGKYIKTCKSGLHYVNPLAQDIIILDCRVLVLDIPVQRLMTKDSLPIAVDSCIYYHIKDPHLGYYRGATQEGQIKKVISTIIKNTITHFVFQDLLEKRTQITQDIMKQIQQIGILGGLVVDRICLKNFSITKELEADLTSAAVARRNAQCKVLTAQGQVEVARMIHDGAQILNTRTAIQVRYLQTLEKIGRNQNTHLIYHSR